VASKIDHVLHAVRGPALERPRPTFTTHAAHHQFRREHPAFHNPDIWTQKSRPTSTTTKWVIHRSGVSPDAVRRHS
jgi:hypothetical protein